MKKSTKEIIKGMLIWLGTAILFGCYMFYFAKESDRGFTNLLIYLSSALVATEFTYFYYVKKFLKLMENYFGDFVGNKSIGKFIAAFSVFTGFGIIFIAFSKIMSVCGAGPMPTKSLVLIAAIFAGLVTLTIYLLRLCKTFGREEELDNSIYDGPCCGDAMLFLVPKDNDKKGTPELVACNIPLWQSFRMSLNEPIVGLTHSDALFNACMGIKVFEDATQFNIRDRLACVIKVGACVAAMNIGEDRNKIISIYQKCCELNDDEAVSLSAEDLDFIIKNRLSEDNPLTFDMLNENWKEIKHNFKRSTEQIHIRVWIDKVRLLSVKGNNVKIEVPNGSNRWAEKHKKQLEDAIYQTCNKEVNIEFI